ncbi:Nitric oxide-responding transcriptional regulator Dnr (Crp/Fnr family) [hydrothermal vent metagenome]|uniref:Nitric oxide-responding transcriptional regulator Dnr (Crp/Fnr family) n=1 Tax=hydrothermal vent metagenome TaxID=652676 RepID=A0A1W1ELB7_9ZZZZ
MKKVFFIYIILASLLYASTRGSVQVLESTENIRYFSQKLVKDYLYFDKYSHKHSITWGMKKDIRTLGDNLRKISMTVSDDNSQGIIEFLSYTKDQITDILNHKIDKDSVLSMLDYSEVILEGIDSISKIYTYDFTDEEKMFMTTKRLEYLLERVTKFHMAFKMNFNTEVNRVNIINTIASIDKEFNKIKKYKYPLDMKKEIDEIIKLWKINKVYLEPTTDIFVPTLIIPSIIHLEEQIKDIALYHSKKL